VREPAERFYYGVAIMTMSSLLFGVMAIAAKHAATQLPGPEVAFVRFLIGLLACAVVATRHRFVFHNWRGLVMRGAFGGAAVYLYFLTIEHLSVGTATLLNYTSPVFTALWAALFLREGLRVSTVLALAITTVGVMIVIGAQGDVVHVTLDRWQLTGLASAVLSGAAVATIREVRRTDGSWEIFASFCLIGAIITGVPAVPHWVSPTPRLWFVLGAVGVISIAAQLLMTFALGFVRAAIIGLVQQLTPVVTMAVGASLYGDRLSPLALGGAAITLVGVSVGAYYAAARRD
jgi:drug/metabolite transporter (DMT)-like permease